MRKSIIAKVVTGALVGVLVSACSAEKNTASVDDVEPQRDALYGSDDDASCCLPAGASS